MLYFTRVLLIDNIATICRISVEGTGWKTDRQTLMGPFSCMDRDRKSRFFPVKILHIPNLEKTKSIGGFGMRCIHRQCHGHCLETMLPSTFSLQIKHTGFFHFICAYGKYFWRWQIIANWRRVANLLTQQIEHSRVNVEILCARACWTVHRHWAGCKLCQE